MTHITEIKFTENANVKNHGDKFEIISVVLAPVVKSWHASVFSFEWLNPDGSIRTKDQLQEAELIKREAVEAALESAKSLEMPVLGIGMMDNVEIGSGQEVMLTLAALDVKMIKVHIPKSCAPDFEKFKG